MTKARTQYIPTLIMRNSEIVQKLPARKIETIKVLYSMFSRKP